MKRAFVVLASVAFVISSAVFADEQKTAEAVTITPPPKADSAKPEPAKAKEEVPTVRPLAVTVELTGGTKLQGTLMETSELAMRTSFGQATIPLSEVAGIRLASEGNAVTTVIMHNGDSVTGATELNRLLVETEWGKADITGSSISSVLFAQGLQWTSVTALNGSRWALTEVKPPAVPQQPQNSGVTNAGGVQPQNSVVRPVSGFRTINGR